jgi:hypothetical protein
LCDETAVDKKQFMDDSCNRGTFGGCFATTLGSCIHELGHTFDLGHASHGVMSRDFDNVHEFFLGEKSLHHKWWHSSASLILSAHRWFNDYQDSSGSERSITLIDNKLVKSLHGIVVIEYRARAPDCNVLTHECFTLPTKIAKLNCISDGCSLFIIDALGNILKRD